MLGLDEETLVVCNETGRERIELTHAQAAAWLRLPFAQTYASCQGSEFEGSLRLWDTDSRHFTRRRLFVAVSRAKEGCAIRV